MAQVRMPGILLKLTAAGIIALFACLFFSPAMGSDIFNGIFIFTIAIAAVLLVVFLVFISFSDWGESRSAPAYGRDERPKRHGVGFFLNGIKPLIVVLFCPMALVAAMPGLQNTNSLFGILYSVSGIVAGIPHEIGHFIAYVPLMLLTLFSPGTDRLPLMFFAVLAGTLAGVLAPLAIAIYFAVKKDALGTSAFLGFVAFSLAHASWYAGTAEEMYITNNGSDDLFAPGSHNDWYWMMTYTSSFNSSQSIVRSFQAAASVAGFLSLAILAAHMVLWLMRQNGGTKGKPAAEPPMKVWAD